MRYVLDGGLPILQNVVIPGKGRLPLVDVSAASLSHRDLGRPALDSRTVAGANRS